MKILFWICLLLLIILASCTKGRNSNNKGEATTSEEYLASIHADTFLDIGREPNEIFNNLKNIRLQSQLLKYIKDRGQRSNIYKVQQRDFGVFQIYEDIHTSSRIIIEISYLIKNDSILYGQIESIDSSYVPLFEPHVFIEDETRIQQHINEHNAFYGTHKQKEDFLKEVIGTKSKIIIACGYDSGGCGKKEKAVFRTAIAQDTAFLSRLLTSMNIEDQVLGVIGYEQMKSAGSPPSKWAADIIQHVVDRNSTIYRFSDCTSKNEKTQSYIKMISRFRREDIIALLQNPDRFD